ncbi:hypothetical protein Q3O60_16855 [Alkalimonas collagenimarina]|uniref:CopG family transcriptional regulator n=1 Tax=Alkalimonas collagenimarina TaxID=400390 RepID=A0ABT9H3F4_9GAMM|nr:hypothetical protein [Alkalimonas collagenimarina]MDP4537856.1 hypothetical protein [Alkalimonas collagenimarina]
MGTGRYLGPQLISESDLSDDQEALWFYNFLSIRGWLQNKTPPIGLQTFALIRAEVINSIKMLYTRAFIHVGISNAPAHIFNDIKQFYEASLLEKSDYAFIRKLNSRAQNAIWIYISQITMHTPRPRVNVPIINSELENKREKYRGYHFSFGPIYKLYTINSYPLSTAELTTSIINFFQIWEATADVKEYHLGVIRALTEHIQTFQNAFKWLNKSSESQCSWAADYMKTQVLFQEQFPVNTSSDQYNAVVASFDYWHTSLEAKQLFLIKMKRAWSVKKYRDKQQGKKPYSFIMSKKVSKMLANLAAESDVSKSQLVEELIIREHSNKIKQ